MDKLEYTGEDLDDSEDEDMSWYTDDLKSTYFVIVNNSRKTINPGEQIYFNYGNETNDHFMLRYGFCFENNKSQLIPSFFKCHHLFGNIKNM